MISWDHVYGISRIKLISVTCAPSLLYLHFLLEGFQRKTKLCLERGKMVWMSTPEWGIKQKTTQAEAARPDYCHWSITGHDDLQSPCRSSQPPAAGRQKWSRLTAPPCPPFSTDPLPPGLHPHRSSPRALQGGASPQGLVWGQPVPKCKTAATARHWLLERRCGLLGTPLQAYDTQIKLQKVMPSTFWKSSCSWDGYRRILPTSSQKMGQGE